MFTPEQMELISVLIGIEKEKELVSRLVRLGIFHPVDIKQADKKLFDLDGYSNHKELEMLSQIEVRLGNITSKINLESFAGDSGFVDREKVLKIVGNIEDGLTPLLEKKNSILNEIKAEEFISGQILQYVPFPGYNYSGMTFLETIVGKIEEKNLCLFQTALANIPYFFYPFGKENLKIVFLVVLLKRDKNILNEAFNSAHCEKIEISSEMSIADPEKTKESLKKKKQYLDIIEGKILDMTDKFKKDIETARFFVRFERSMLEAKKFAYATKNTILISGWVPCAKKNIFFKEVEKVSMPYYMESKKPEETNIPKENVPVSLDHSFWVKPFEFLTETYGVPRYGSIDPTSFVVFTFPVIFGAMFGDFGQGLILAVLGVCLMRNKNENLMRMGMLVFYCGATAAAFGLLYGSSFGMESAPVWLKPMENITRIFKACIFSGIGLLTFGILMNIINSIKDKNYMKMFFDNAGLLSGIFYWSVIGICISFVYSGFAPFFLVFLMCASMFVFFLKPLIEKIVLKKEESMIFAFVENIIDIMEVSMSYLANTVSFLRIAAFALAHAGLFVAVFQIAGMLKNVAGGHLSTAVIILGNIMIMLLEGLIVGIQSVRLHYYEFFSRFFVNGKEKYKPVKI